VVLYRDYRIVETFVFTRDKPLDKAAADAVLDRVKQMIAVKK
jgi:hypothetical protein